MSNDFDTEQANRFLAALRHDNEIHDFRTFDDKKDRKEPSLTHTFRGTFDDCKDQLAELNKQGAGVFVTVNQSDGAGIGKKNITGVSAVWQDDDDGFGGNYPLEPNIVVQSSEGKYQRYWLTEEGMTHDQHQQVMDTLVTKYGADNGAKDVSRILRVPGFNHCKGDPVRAELVGEIITDRYSPDKILKAFPPIAQTVNNKRLDKAIRSTLDIKPGNRNTSLTSYAGELWNKGITGDELYAVLRTRNAALSEPLPDNEIVAICASAEHNFDAVPSTSDPQDLVEELKGDL
ncbi:MAG: hypothetical protein HOG37_13130 [Gammaproteobacteria bacterium]|jgi:hypothetical protein|nr:hypothetical protein [Gammaproteobacteria bacterium]